VHLNVSSASEVTLKPRGILILIGNDVLAFRSPLITRYCQMIACFKLFAERGSEYARKEYKHIMTSYVGALEVGTSNSRLAGFHLGLVNGCM
jgi:hypothetical protein